MRGDCSSPKAAIEAVAVGGATAFVIYLASAGVAASAQLLIARLVGAETYGIYAYVTAWMTILAYSSALGFDTALLRFVAAYRAMEAWSLVRGIIQYAERRVLAVGILVVLAGTLVVLSLPRLSVELRDTFLVGFFIVPVWALLWLRCATVRAFGGVTLAVLPDKIVRDGFVLVLVVVATVVLGVNVDARRITMATLAGSVVALWVVSTGLRRLRPSALTGILPEYAAATWRRTAVPLLVVVAAQALLNRSGVLLLGWFGETREAGIYNLVFSVALLVVLPRTAINILFAPTISSLFARRDRASLQGLVATAGALALCAAVCMALALAVFAEPILSWFGRDFVAGVPALRILLAGQVVAASCGSQLSVMTMTEHERGAAALLILSAIVSIIAGVIFIAFLGLAGAAIATTIALIIWNVAMAQFISRHLQLMPGVLGMIGLKSR